MRRLFWLARLLTPDMLLTFWITAAIASAVRRHRGGGAWWNVAFFAAMGFGFMTKGPLALVVPLCAVIGLRWKIPPRERPRMPWVAGLAGTLVLGLSWFVAQSVAHEGLFRYFAGYELVSRFASGAHGRSKPWWFFLAVLPVAFLPWSACWPAAGSSLWRRWRSKVPMGPQTGLLLGWIVPPFIILSFSGSKLPTYILPLLPALCLGVVGWWQTRGRQPEKLHWVAAGSLALLVVTAGLREQLNPWLKQQAATESLAFLARSQPDFSEAALFATRVRAHGFTFSTSRLVAATEDEADIVLDPTPEQQRRLFKDAASLEKAMALLPAAYGLVRQRCGRGHGTASAKNG